MFTIGILIAVAIFGAVLARAKLVSDSLKQHLFRYVYYVATPIAVVYALITHKLSNYSEYGVFLLANGSVYLSVFILLYIYMKKRRFPYKTAGAIAFSADTPNSVFLGFPLILALFHNGTFIYAVLIGSLMDAVLNFLRILSLERYKKRRFTTRSHKKRKLLLMIKSILNPFLIALILGFGVVYFEVSISKNIMSSLGYIGQSASFAALFVLGLSVGNLKIAKKDREELAVISLVKLFAMPLLVLVVSTLLGLNKAAINAGVFIAALPTAIFSLVVAANLKLDQRLAASAILVTTTLSLITIPIWYYILRTLN